MAHQTSSRMPTPHNTLFGYSSQLTRANLLAQVADLRLELQRPLLVLELLAVLRVVDLTRRQWASQNLVVCS